MLKRIWTFPFVIVALLALPANHANAAKIGVTSAVKNQVSGVVGGRQRVLSSGAAIFQNEMITTGDASSAQLLFRDRTSMTIGAKSSVMLDKFVYDPRSKTGKIILNVAKGAFRFVSGAARSDSYRIKTPVATISVRGTVIEGYLIGGTIVLVLIEGAFDVTTRNADGTTTTKSVNQPGTFITIGPDGSITGPNAWTGPTLNLGAGVQFVFDTLGNLQNPGGDVLPHWKGLNDQLDAKNLDLNFPPPTPHAGGKYRVPTIPESTPSLSQSAPSVTKRVQ